MNCLRVAREHYVVCRVALLSGYSISAFLLAQQSIEMYLKAMIKANGDGTTYNQHNLVDLLSKGRKISGIAQIGRNPMQKKLLEELYVAYDKMRFGEDQGHTHDNVRVLRMIDELALSFEKMFKEKMYPSQRNLLYVHNLMRVFFLKENSYFTPSMITNNIMDHLLPTIRIEAILSTKSTHKEKDRQAS